MKKLSPAQFVAACAALGGLRSGERKEWTLVSNALKAHCESTRYRFAASQIAVCLYSIARSGTMLCIRDRAVVSAFQRLLQESKEWSPVDMGWMLYFMRKKATVDHPIWERLLKHIAYRFNERLGDMSVRNIACILHELSLENILPGQAIHRALAAVDERGTRVDLKSASLLLAALSRLGVYRADFVNSFIDRISAKGEMSSREAVSILHSAAKLGVFNRRLVSSVMGHVDESLSDLDVVTVAHSLGRLGVASTDAKWSVLCEAFRKRLKRMSPTSVSSFMCALGKVGLVDEPTLTSCTLHLTRNAAKFTPRQRLNILNAMAILGVDSGNFSLPDMDDLDPEVSRFQMNRILLSRDATLEGEKFPISHPKNKAYMHTNVSDFLRINSASEVETCVAVGCVFADATFLMNNQRYALLILGDSDVCKLDPGRFLGPAQWLRRYLEAQQYSVLTVHKRNAARLEKLWKATSLASVINTEPKSVTSKHRTPFIFSDSTGKISFIQVSRCR